VGVGLGCTGRGVLVPKKKMGLNGKEQKKNTKKKSFPSFIILKDCFKPYTFVLPLSTNSLLLRKRKFGNTLCSSQSTNHGLYLTQSSIKLGKKKSKEKKLQQSWVIQRRKNKERKTRKYEGGV
jgi:hypothetical protein